ncbi:PREDICTED: uncharacterized protein LOC109213617 [Nicotiana attenuata]|uniref:uncharacterized protein LOC109213617 n=1 Tax=Nicotiana attenuata TaxID=49451 RepID=UPI0009058FD6|nr:PREDICTED: uncharacterized protein LOC109213617 [Nicotiana attenuata]
MDQGDRNQSSMDRDGVQIGISTEPTKDVPPDKHNMVVEAEGTTSCDVSSASAAKQMIPAADKVQDKCNTILVPSDIQQQVAEPRDQFGLEEATKTKGKDLDEESTTQNFKRVASQGDLSPRHMDTGRSVGRGKKKNQRENPRKLERYRRKIGFLQAFSNVSNKIWVFVDEDHGVDLMINTKQQMTMKLTNMDTQISFIVTFVYAKCDPIERIELWDSMFYLARDMTIPWLVAGDFNVIWDEEEKFGGLPVSLNETFRFLNFWIKHPTFKDVVKDNWKVDFVGDPFYMFNQKLKRLKKALTAWSRITYGNIFQKIASLEEVVIVHEAEFERNPTAQKEEFWKQKAGMNWFQDGDRNTKFFHAQVNGRRKRLQLKRIQNAEGNWLDDTNEMADEAVRFFQNQFHEDAVPTDFRILDHVPTLVNSGQNMKLTQQPTGEEIKYAVMGLNGDSAGGRDGFTGAFFHSCWDIIGEDIMAMVQAFFTGHELPRYILHTNLVLLPKKKQVETFSYMRPISLRRSIVENILLTQEIVTDIRLRTKAEPNVVIKLDMMKDYDRLSWLFLSKVLRRMGFGERFIGLIFGVVSNNWYSMLITGQPNGFFISTRGVKQGDPLSPTLFILAAEAMSRGLNALHSNMHFCGFGLPKWSPKINHLAYADDTIIFSSSDATSLMLVMEVLTSYEAASGQLINKNKSAIYLHESAGAEVVDKVQMITGIPKQDFPFT